MPSTTSATSTSTSSTASATSTDATYDFSIKEATIRNTAIGVCLALFVFLLCALIGLEIMRRRLKRMRKQLVKYMRQQDEFGFSSTQYLSPEPRMKLERSPSGVASDEAQYHLVSPVMRAPERCVTEVSGQGEVFESDARSVHSFRRGSTTKHNKNVVSKWYDIRAHMNRES